MLGSNNFVLCFADCISERQEQLGTSECKWFFSAD